MRYWIEPRDPSRLFAAVLREFEGPGAMFSFEGNLTQYPLWALEDASDQPTDVLGRQTITPVLGFVIAPLTTRNVHLAIRSTSGPSSLGAESPIIHGQVAVGSQLVFGAYDNFHPDCTFIDRVSDAVLLRMQHEGLILRFEAAAQ